MRTRLLLLAAALGAAPAAAQSTLLVPQDHAAIQDAIAAAANGDTVLVSAGTYLEQIDFLGKAITVRSSAGPNVTTIDSGGAAIWPDYPFGAVVRMVSGEGRDSVLEGFTVTGGLSPDPGISIGYNGIVSDAGTIRHCVVTGNVSGGPGAGIQGSPLIEACVISDNDGRPYADGGGVSGAPTIVGSVITGNRSGGLGGGLHATGPCQVTDAVFDSNVAGNGVDGYSGGGVFGPATLERCQITRNAAHHWFSGGPPDTIGTGVDGAAALVNCTIADNLIAGGPVPGETSGAVRHVPIVENCILWNNQGNEIALDSNPDVSFSIVAGGHPGPGNLDMDPEFRDAASGDYFLEPTSPAIDAGNPASPPDPDGTVADMGAHFFPQYAAAVAVKTGTGVNPLCYTTGVAPVIGSTWVGSVDATAHGIAATAVVVVGYAADLGPLDLGFGELLVDPTSPLVLSSVEVPVGGVSTHAVPVPPNHAFGGLTVHTQAVVVGPALGLCNGLDLTLGI